MLKNSLINLSEISVEIWGYKFFTALRETFSIISCIWYYNKIMAQKSVFHKISHLYVIKLIIWTTSPSPLLALGDLEEKELCVLFCLLVLKVQLREKASNRNLYFPKGSKQLLQ